MTAQDAFNLAVQRHQAGDLAAAEALYAKVLDLQADHADALHGLGLLAHQNGRHEAAAGLIGRAIALKPGAAYYYLNLGSIYTAMERVDEAAAALGRALELQPDFAQAHYNLGNVLCDKGDWNGAVKAYEDALRLRTDHADTQFNLACALNELGETDAAVRAVGKAIGLRGNFAEAHHLLGLLMRRQGRTAEAVAAYRRALALKPDSAELLNNLANALYDGGEFLAAKEVLDRAVQLKPGAPEIHCNRGNALRGLGYLDEAETAYRQALLLRPGDVQTQNNLAGIFHARGELDEAESLHRRILAEHPDFAAAHWDLGLILLARGEYEQGWKEYEWRWRVPELRLGMRLKTPRWDGGELGGKTILLHGEQGLGDVIQFVRYVPMVKERGGRIVLVCRHELAPLFEKLQGIEQCSADDQAMPAHDVHCPLLSLPGLLGTMAEAGSYIAADPRLIARWKGRIGADGRRKIGLVWAGKSYPDPFRSAPAECLAPLAKVADVRWISLQASDAACEPPPAGLEVGNFAAELKDFAQTAALIANLDLVITIDTATAHLAGAMGKPTWVMVKHVPDWRWGLSGDRCAWYPGVRIFRQARRGDWQKLIAEIVSALQ